MSTANEERAQKLASEWGMVCAWATTAKLAEIAQAHLFPPSEEVSRSQSIHLLKQQLAAQMRFTRYVSHVIGLQYLSLPLREPETPDLGQYDTPFFTRFEDAYEEQLAVNGDDIQMRHRLAQPSEIEQQRDKKLMKSPEVDVIFQELRREVQSKGAANPAGAIQVYAESLKSEPINGLLVPFLHQMYAFRKELFNVGLASAKILREIRKDLRATNGGMISLVPSAQSAQPPSGDDRLLAIQDAIGIYLMHGVKEWAALCSKGPCANLFVLRGGLLSPPSLPTAQGKEPGNVYPIAGGKKKS